MQLTAHSRWPLVILSVWLSATAAADELISVRHPDLSELDGVVREAILAAQQFVSEAEQKGEQRSLGMSFGELGMAYHAHELPLGAEDSYRNAESLVPDDARWPYLLGILMQESGRFEQSIEAFQRSLEDNPQYLPADIRLGMVLMDAQRFEDAEAVYLQALRNAPANPAVLDALGRLALQRGDFERALGYLTQALEAQPDANRLYHPLGMAYRGLGQTDKARENLARAGSTQPFFADPVMTDMLGRSQSYARFLSAGMSAAKERKYGISAAYFERALELAPENPNVRISYARVMEALGEKQAAMKQLDRIIQDHPEFAAAYFDKGAMLEQAGDELHAHSLYEQALVANPDHHEARILLANGHMRARRFSDAVTQYETVLVAQPENVQVKFRRALALGQSGACKQSIAEILALIRDFPTDVDLLEAYVRSVAFCAEASQTDRENALNAGRNLAVRYPDSRFVALAALIEAASGDFEAARSFQAQAIFLAVRDGDQDQAEMLRKQMVGYERQELENVAWPADHPFLKPPRVRPEDRF